MFITKKNKRTILLFVLLFFSISIKAQNLTQYNNFYKSKIPEFNKWLEQSNIGNVLIFDTIKVEAKKVKLYLKVFDKSCEKLCNKTNVDRLNHLIDSIYGNTVEKVLFDEFIFLMDLNNNQLEISIESNDAFVDLWYENDSLITNVMTKMGDIEDGYQIKIEKIKGLNKSTSIISEDLIDTIKRKLITGLKRNFEFAESRFEDYKFDVITKLGNDLIINISNVVKLIIKDESYFEHINIKFKFTIINDFVNIDYKINAKYAAGIVWAPKSSDYYDMNINPVYLENLSEFRIKLKDQINDILIK